MLARTLNFAILCRMKPFKPPLRPSFCWVILNGRLMMKLFKIAVLLSVLTGATPGLRAQMAVPPPAPVFQSLADPQLDQLVGAIALYPDPLIAEILPAATLPTQIVLADRYVSGGGDPGQIDQQPWDPSVQALARYPAALKWMDDNLNWTTELGLAFLYQPEDVMRAIQRLRASAYNLGNLQSTPQQEVINDGGDISIDPVDPDLIYVPVYAPDEVYYDAASGSPFVTFGIGCPIGPWLTGDFDWSHHHIFFWNHDHPRPPGWWHEPPHQRDTGHTTVWHPVVNRDVAGGGRGDRGWDAGRPQPLVTTVGRSPSDSVIPRRTPEPAARSEASAGRAKEPAARPEPAERREPSNNVSFIGGEDARETQASSDRGRESLQTSRPASGGGGGSHGGFSGGQKR
jgi:hypothetical protein